jgi:serine/threonine protein kinase
MALESWQGSFRIPDRMVSAMDTATIRSDWVGRVVDGFTLLQWLGGSERGGVFLTEQPRNRSQKAAIKLVPADGAAAEARIAAWSAAAALSHPHLMLLYHAGRSQIDDVPFAYFVTEYADEVLAQILVERALTPPEAREMLDPVIDALSYLHGKGFVHGDLKPTNIMVVSEQLKLSVDHVHGVGEQEKSVEGLRIYDAPECATGKITPASDVWSLGVTLVESLTQHLPVWERSSNVDPILAESIPQPFSTIARECLRRDPERRCTLSDIKNSLAPASSVPDLYTDPVRKVVPPESAGLNDKTPPKSRVAALVGAVLVLVTLIAILMMRSHHADPSVPIASQQSAPENSPSAASSQPPASEAAAPRPRAPAASTSTAEGVVKGEVAERIMPDVLASALGTIQGKVNVQVRAVVDANGAVSKAIFDFQGPSKYFAKVAMQAAERWRFKPAQVDGRPVASVWVLQFQFRRSGTEVTPVEVLP